ncbi:MFS transporter [Microlunatus parietis]
MNPGDPEAKPWRALWALVLGFFMILVDSTIVSVATPVIMRHFDADVNLVVWVTSAYLLAYAVPLLITGRLGDRFGPKNLYQAGLVVFTLASLWCGLTGTIEQLIIARVLQGLGASMMTPQTMAVITRIFPADQRGRAMSLWGAVAGIATLVGPIAGGLLIDGPGWQWIFFVNVPVGVVGFVLAGRLVPRLETHRHRFDLVGVVLSAVGMFCLVFGIQEGQTYHWGMIIGPISVWLLIIVGIVVLAVFVVWQAKQAGEPLVPLGLFGDRNFSLANVGIGAVGFAVTAMGFPLMLYTQSVLGFTPTQSALLMVPMAVMSIVLARFVGRLTDRMHPRYLAGFGTFTVAVSLVWLSRVMVPGAPLWQLLLPITLLGLGSSFMWSPLGTSATRNLPPQRAGAGAGVYNTTRQVGSVLGSAGIAALMQSGLATHLPQVSGGHGGLAETATQLPEPLRAGFAAAMADALLLPAGVILIASVAAIFFATPRHLVRENS